MTAFIPTINKQFISARLAIIALFAGLFILSACGGGAPLVAVNNTTNNIVTDPCADNVFADDCLTAGVARRETALNTCRNTIQANPTATCAPNIPAAAVTCFTDPFSAACKTAEAEYQAVLDRTPDTPKISTLRDERTESCRVDTLTGAPLCGGAIANTCDPAAAAPAMTGSGNLRELLVTDMLCNDVAEYSEERADFLADCRDGDGTNNAGCTETITACAYAPASNANPFDPMCSDATYDIDRIVYCQEAMVSDTDNFNPVAGCVVQGANIVTTYCAANLFTTTAKCSENDDFDDERIAICIEGANAENDDRCKSTVTFTVQQRACFRNPFGDGCDMLLGDNSMTAETSRTTYCRTVAIEDLKADDLCTGAVTNVCTGNEFDALCFADDTYVETRETTCRTTPSNGDCTATIAGLCADAFTKTLSDPPVNLCVDTGGSTTYLDAQNIACLANDQADDSCRGTGGLIDVFCKANPFNPADDCMAVAYDPDRETLCLNEPTHGAGLSCGSIIRDLCLVDPLRQTTEATPADLCGAEHDGPREAKCREIDVMAVGTTAGCVDLVAKTCTFVPAVAGEGGGAGTPASGNPYDTLCDDTVYGNDQTAFCNDPDNMTMSSRCNQDTRNFCDMNPFGSDLIDCGGSYAPERVTACRNFADSGTALPSGADCTDTISGVCSNNVFDTLCTDSEREVSCLATPNVLCVPTITRVCEGVAGGDAPVAAKPFDALCNDDPLYPDLSYTNAREMACINVASGGATPDTGVSTGGTDRCPGFIMSFCTGNPFDTTNGHCEHVNYNGDREAMCSADGAAFGDSQCEGTITRICDADMGNDIFSSICDAGGYGGGYTQQRIDDCTSGSPTIPSACDTAEIYGAICGGDTTNDNTNPFNDVCASATSASGVTPTSLALARQAVVTFCNNPTNKNITANCMAVNNRIDTLNTDCVLVANTFGSGCDYDEYDNNRATFCGVAGGVDSFNPACQEEYETESEKGRAAFITLCRETRDTTGCATIAITDSITLADCITNPYRAECLANSDFAREAGRRTSFCALSINYYDDLCTVDIINGLAERRTTFCATGAGGFSNNCQNDKDVATASGEGRRAFVAACRKTRNAEEGCTTTNIDGTPFDSENPSVTVADCITNPYRRECYGANADDRNRDFIVETVVRDSLCSNGETVFDSLCDEVTVGNVEATRLAVCTNSASAFHARCNEDDYPGTNAVRQDLANTCKGQPDSDDCQQAIVTMVDGQPVTRTVAECVGNNASYLGDPYQSGCEDMLFDDARTEHRSTCAEGDNVKTNPMCANAFATVACLIDPFGNDEENVACDAGIYATPRTTYCSTMATTDDDLCTNIKTVICTGTAGGSPPVLATNPFAQLCGDPSVLTPEQTAFCADAGNTNNINCAANDATGQGLACPTNPFNPDFGINDIDCTVAAYLPERVTRCLDGRQTDATECDKTGIADVICKATGAQANPFVAFCDNAQMAGYDETNTIESIRDTFADNCESTPTNICYSEFATLCLIGGDFFRPFFNGCLGPEIAHAQVLYCRSEEAWDTNCDTMAGTDAEVRYQRIKLLEACETDVAANRPTYCSSRMTDMMENILVTCVKTPFASICDDSVINGLLAGYRAEVCNEPTTSFTDGCNENDFTGTGAAQRAFAEVCERDRAATGCDAMTVGSVPIHDCVNNAMGNPYAEGCVGLAGFEQQRIARALDCAETPGGTGCDAPVSGVASTTTVAGCNTDPFLAGCDGVIFANARRDKCIDDGASKHADCSVAEGQGYTNYVQGSLTELDTSSVVMVEDTVSTTEIDESTVIEQGGLNLAAIGGDTDSGFAFAYISTGRGADGIEGTDRYYAGLLSDTDVGAPLAQQPASGDWNGRLAIVNGYGGEVRTRTADFVLTVNFADKTIDSGDVEVLDGLFNIDGRFTGGVIYGVTSFRDRTPSGSKEIIIGSDSPITRETAPQLSSRGSVTGVIGVDGAVGAFISSGAGVVENTFGEYAGGFVARPNAPPPPVDSCLHPSNQLRADCIADDAQHYDVCVTTAQINSQKTTDFCAPIVARYIERETACVGETNLNTLTNPLCEPVITQVCGDSVGSIFKTAAGTGGATTFDCTTITRYDARRVQICSIPAYRDGAIVELNGVVSLTSGIPACTAILDDACNDNPFIQEVGRRPKSLCVGDSYNTARETKCAQDIIAVVTAGAGVASNSVSAANAAPSRCFDTILRACAANPFNPDLCYSTNVDFLGTRLSACIATPSVNTTDCPTILSTNCPTDGSPRNRECISDGFKTWRDNATIAGTAITDVAIPDGETQNSRVLLGGGRGLDTRTNVASIRVAETFLRFNSRYTRMDTGTTVTRLGEVIPVYNFVENDDYYHGVSFFSATAASGQIGHYAGILVGTEVGALPPALNISATWYGKIGWVSSDKSVPLQSNNFVLNVDFENNRISSSNNAVSQRTVSLEYPLAELRLPSAEVTPFIRVPLVVRTSETREYVIADRFSLTGNWDGSTGVLRGTTTLVTEFSLSIEPLERAADVPGLIMVDRAISTGKLTGIIGADRAVGVFVSDETQTDGRAVHYAGGFFASPSPSADVYDWETSFNEVSTVANTIGANAAGDILLEAGVFTKTGRPADSSYFIEVGENGLGLRFNDTSPLHNRHNTPEYFLESDGTTGAIRKTVPRSGAVFWAGFVRDNAQDNVGVAHLYAGLLPRTDAGLPLPQGTGATFRGEPNATWDGTISGIFRGDGLDMIGEGTIAELTRNGDRLTDTGFQLLIDFGAGTIKTPVGQESFGNFKLSLDGNFEGGIMAGAVALAPVGSALMTRGAGRFSGVIGTRGAIGVFKSDNDDTESNGYIGGFVAAPPPPPPRSVPARFSTWTDSFDVTTRMNTANDVLLAEGGIAIANGANATTHFITGKADGSGLGFEGNPLNISNVAERFLRLDGTTGATGDSSGVAFWAGSVQAGIVHFYAGLLSGTDVGLALPRGIDATFQDRSSAIWTGTIRGLFGNSGGTDFGASGISGFTKDGNDLTDTNFQLLVNYGTGALTTPVGKESFGTVNFKLDGSFDENGVMTGAYTAEASRPAGRFGGIIGTTGAVGVFKSDGVSNSIVGGFVAKPPAP